MKILKPFSLSFKNPYLLLFLSNTTPHIPTNKLTFKKTLIPSLLYKMEEVCLMLCSLERPPFPPRGVMDTKIEIFLDFCIAFLGYKVMKYILYDMG